MSACHSKAGYENVHVDNLFVYHKHGGSFPSEEKQRLLKEHSDALLRKHPDYNKGYRRLLQKRSAPSGKALCGNETSQ